MAIVAPLGLSFVRELSVAVARRRVDPAALAATPIYIVAITLTALALDIPGNHLSRKIEASADEFALELIEGPAALGGALGRRRGHGVEADRQPRVVPVEVDTCECVRWTRQPKPFTLNDVPSRPGGIPCAQNEGRSAAARRGRD